MDKKVKTILLLGVIAIMLTGTAVATSTAAASAQSKICEILKTIRELLYFIAGGIAAVVITLQGIKWAASADDPGARKQAKEGIIHAVVGLVIVLLAVWVVMMIFAGGCTLT